MGHLWKYLCHHGVKDRVPIAQRGKAKQKRADLRLLGLGLVVKSDVGMPLAPHARPWYRQVPPSSLRKSLFAAKSVREYYLDSLDFGDAVFRESLSYNE